MSELLYLLGGVALGGGMVFLAFRFPVSGFRNRIVVIRPDRMPEKEVERALTKCPDSHPVYRSFMQLLYQALDEAHVNAEEEIDVPRKLEAHTGGGKYVRSILENVLARRRAAALRRGTSNVQRPTSNVQ